MKKLLVVLFALAGLNAGAQVRTPLPSPNASVMTMVGLTEVKVEYSRPKAKGRKIFGDGDSFVTPYGKMWRTAANNGTRVTFSDTVKFGGAKVPKGTYLLLTIPGATEWTVILYKDVNMGGDLTLYKQDKDQVRVTAKPQMMTDKVEAFTIEISDLSANSKMANLQLMWDNVSVKVPVEVDFDKAVMASIEASTKVNPGNYYQAASYYLENGKDLNQALTWINKGIESNKDAYWMWLVKAKIQKGLGDKKGAMESSAASKAAAVTAKNDDYVRQNDEFVKGLK
jgi:Protein of unknown function (DUF2911)